MEATLVHTPVQCPNVLALQQFMRALGISVNRLAVREAVQQAPHFPLVSLRDLDEILRAWQFETVVFRVQPTALARLSQTLLAHCTWSDGDKYFVVIRKVETGLVHYFSPFQGEVVQSIGAFAHHWSGALLAAEPG